MPVPSPAPAPRWARRDVLRTGLGASLVGLPLVAGLAGCSTSPVIDAPPGSATGSGSPTPGAASPAPTPAVPAAATAEQNLSVYAAAILAGPHAKDLNGARKDLLTFLRDAHADHALALAGDDPTSRPTEAAPSPTATPPDLAKASLTSSLASLARLESAQAGRQRRAAVAASGLSALVAGSLATAAASYASALAADDPPGVGSVKAHRPMALLSDVAAAQQLVAQLHAVVYGYQLAIGKLKYSSASRKRALSELAAARRTLDEQIAFLLTRKADVPAAEPAYTPSPDPRSASDAGRLIRGMQTRLEPYAGLTLVAAATEDARTAALTLLGSTNRTARSWGTGLQAWPGWAD